MPPCPAAPERFSYTRDRRWHRKRRARRNAAGSFLLHVTAELVAHGRQQLVLKRRIAARCEPLEKRRGQHGYRDSLVDCGPDRPAAFTRIGDASAEFRQLGIAEERNRD